MNIRLNARTCLVQEKKKYQNVHQMHCRKTYFNNYFDRQKSFSYNFILFLILETNNFIPYSFLSKKSSEHDINYMFYLAAKKMVNSRLL